MQTFWGRVAGDGHSPQGPEGPDATPAGEEDPFQSYPLYVPRNYKIGALVLRIVQCTPIHLLKRFLKHICSEMEMGQWVMGHGSNGSPFLDGSRGSRVTAGDPLTYDDEITALACIFCSWLTLRNCSLTQLALLS